MNLYFVFFFAIFSALSQINCIYAIMFHLAPNTQKCLKEDIQANQLVMGEYEVSDVPGQVIDYIVSTFSLREKKNLFYTGNFH